MCLFDAKTVIYGCGAVERKEEKIDDCRKAECIRSRYHCHPKSDNVHGTGCVDLKETRYVFESGNGKCQHSCTSPPQDKFDVKYMLAVSKMYDDIENQAMQCDRVKVVREATVGSDTTPAYNDSE